MAGRSGGTRTPQPPVLETGQNARRTATVNEPMAPYALETAASPAYLHDR